MENGLWFLHTTAERTDTVHEGETTRWKPATKGPRNPLKLNSWIALTAASVHAMELLGHDLKGVKHKGRYDDPYAEDVRRGLNSLVLKLKRCPIGNPGRLGLPAGQDAKGLTLDVPDSLIYEEAALVLMALADSGAATTEVLAYNKDLRKEASTTTAGACRGSSCTWRTSRTRMVVGGAGRGSTAKPAWRLLLAGARVIDCQTSPGQGMGPLDKTVERLRGEPRKNEARMYPKNFAETAAAAICLMFCESPGNRPLRRWAKTGPRTRTWTSISCMPWVAAVFANARNPAFRPTRLEVEILELLIDRAKRDGNRDEPSRGWYWPGSIRPLNDRTLATAWALHALQRWAATAPP